MLLLGVLQAQAAGGVAGSFDLLETQVLGSSQASVTFSSLSTYAADYQHLQIRITARTDRTELGDVVKVRLNGDTGSNYAYHNLWGNGSSVVSNAYSSQSEMWFFRIAAANSAANIFGAMVMDILDPFSSSKNTTIRALSGQSGGVTEVYLSSGLWNNTAALTSINLDQLGSNFVTGSRFSLYGIRAV